MNDSDENPQFMRCPASKCDYTIALAPSYIHELAVGAYHTDGLTYKNVRVWAISEETPGSAQGVCQCKGEKSFLAATVHRTPSHAFAQDCVHKKLRTKIIQ